MVVSGQHHALAEFYPQDKDHQNPMERSLEWPSQLVWMQRLEKFSASVGD
jgi:hypothetical protein